MALVKRGNSKFWYAQFQLHGRTYVRSTKTTDKRVAAKIEASLRTEALIGNLDGPSDRLALSDAINRLIDSKVGTPNHRNLLCYRNAILKELSGSSFIDALSPGDLVKLKQSYERKGLSAQTIRHRFNLISASIRYARRCGFRTKEIEFPSIRLGKGRLRYLSIDEERRLLEELSPDRQANGLPSCHSVEDPIRSRMQDNYDLVVLLLDTGARHGEIASLKWDQIDFQSKTINLWRSKVGNESQLFMTARVLSILERRAKTLGTFVFSNKSGGPRGYRPIAIRKALNRAGLFDCSIHTLRHTHATRLIQKGMSIYEVQKVLGHADMRTTMRYAHLEDCDVHERARDIIDDLGLPLSPFL